MANDGHLKDDGYSYLWRNTQELTRRFTVGVREVARDHALAGNSVPVWRNGKVVMLTPEEVLEELRRTAEQAESGSPAGTP